MVAGYNVTSNVSVDSVLAIVWIDNAAVRMLTTHHHVDAKVTKHRKRPSRYKKGPNADRARQYFGQNQFKDIDIPKIIDDYNHHMNGVDKQDQRRSYYSIVTQHRTSRIWMPLFFFLLDTVMVNSHLVGVLLGCPMKENKSYYHDVIEHLLYGQTVLETVQLRSRNRANDHDPAAPDNGQESNCGIISQSNIRKVYVSKKFKPPLSRRTNLPHKQVRLEGEARMHCVYCRWQAKLHNKNRHSCQTRFACNICKVPLCRDSCFEKWHQ
jgi:hypothetical protein